MSLFWKLVGETQISKPPEPTRHHNSIKLLIPLSLRAELIFTLQYEIPCIIKYLVRLNKILYLILIFASELIFPQYYCEFESQIEY